MYTVLIVDDEPLVQVGLQSMVDWSLLDARLLPCVSNGQAALDSIQREHPDIVFTDIRMPLMDGLELIRRCQSLEPRPAFVVLTSFEDFGYAREAVKNDVVDYLVKLELTPEVLIQAFEKARRRVGASQTKATEAFPDQGFRDRVLFSLLNHSFATEDEVSRNFAEVGCALDGNHYVAVTCRLAEGELDTYAYGLKMLRENLGREFPVLTLPYSRDRVVLLLASRAVGQDQAAAETRVAASVSSALVMVQRYFNSVVEAGVGRAVAERPLLAESHRESLRALEVCRPEAPVVTFRSLSGGTRAVTGERFRQDLETALQTQDAQALKAAFSLAKGGIEDHGRLTDALDLGTAAVYAVLSAHTGGEAWLTSCFAHEAEGYKSLYSVPSADHVLRWLEALESGLADEIADSGSRHQEKLVDSMRRFVEVHCRERLQLKTVAEHFRLSANYAGTLFRRFSGQSFSEFVCAVKVAKAQELLASRKYRIYEVSDLLGFENSYYFSKVFRRVTGISPREHLARTSPS